jgi:hypothetical protein
MLMRTIERESDDRATDSEHGNETCSGNSTATPLMPPSLFDQLWASDQ